MKLEYIEDFNEYEENIIRLYNFDKIQAIKFRDLIQDVIVNRKQKLDLSKVDFIKNENCSLILGLFKTDEGIISNDNKNFICALTLEGFKNMLKLLEPFCNKETKSYQYLYDIDNPTDFMFSPSGT
ncbi:MAG: hypothetical protein HRT66_05070 [Flavobacteriaceae bacterium]|nr:hypothetical protein [Flavobacteriaceae bacterium]